MVIKTTCTTDHYYLRWLHKCVKNAAMSATLNHNFPHPLLSAAYSTFLSMYRRIKALNSNLPSELCEDHPTADKHGFRHWGLPEDSLPKIYIPSATTDYSQQYNLCPRTHLITLFINHPPLAQGVPDSHPIHPVSLVPLGRK